MIFLNINCRTVGCLVKLQSSLVAHNCCWQVSGYLHSNLHFRQLLIHRYHYSSKQLGQIQPILPNLGIKNIGRVHSGCNVLPVSNASMRVMKFLLHVYLPQYYRLLYSSTVTGFCSRPNGLHNAHTSFTTEQGQYSISQMSQKLDHIYCGKRYVGRSSRQQDGDASNSTINASNTRLKLQDRTRSALKGRVSRLHNSILHHKARLRDKIRAQKLKGALAVGTIHKRFEVKKEDVRTIPNLLTTMRMASAPLLAYLVVNESFGLACSIFVLAGITDMLDGYIARNFKNQTTALGTALDPLADKLLVSFLTVSLTSVGLIPVPLTALILSRDAGLIIATFYIRYISLAPPRTLSRYFDVSHVTAKLYPSNISKLNTLLQLSFVASTLASPVFDYIGHPLLQALMYLTAATTFLSGADYMLTWRQRLQIIKNK